MDKETYLGDAVYASFDGYQIWLRTGDGNNQRIALEPAVLDALFQMVDALKEDRQRQAEDMAGESELQALPQGGERAEDGRPWDQLDNVTKDSFATFVTEIERDKRQRAASKPERKWQELSATEQASIRCADQQFQEWLYRECVPGDLPDWVAQEWESQTSAEVRKRCGVVSRRELATNDSARAAWNAIEVSYAQATNGMAERRS